VGRRKGEGGMRRAEGGMCKGQRAEGIGHRAEGIEHGVGGKTESAERNNGHNRANDIMSWLIILEQRTTDNGRLAFSTIRDCQATGMLYKVCRFLFERLSEAHVYFSGRY